MISFVPQSLTYGNHQNGFFAPTDAGNFLTVATNLISPVARALSSFFIS